MEEDPHQEDLLKMPPPGFQEIARFLTVDDSPRTTTSIPPDLMPPGLVAVIIEDITDANMADDHSNWIVSFTVHNV